MSENKRKPERPTRPDLVLPRAVLGSPRIGQIHVLKADSLIIGRPVLQEATLGEAEEGSDVG